MNKDTKKLIEDWKRIFNLDEMKIVIMMVYRFLLKLLKPLNFIFIILFGLLFYFLVPNLISFSSDLISKIPENPSGSLDISLEIATSISIILAMIIFLITIITENIRDKKARRNEFKLKKLEQIHEKLMIYKKRFEEDFDEYQDKMDSVLKPFDKYIEIKTDADRFLGNEQFFSENPNELLMDFIDEKALDLARYLEALMKWKRYPAPLDGKNSPYPSVDLREIQKQLKTDINEFHDWLNFDPLIKWSIGEDRLHKIEKALKDTTESFSKRLQFNNHLDTQVFEEFAGFLETGDEDGALEFGYKWLQELHRHSTFDHHDSLEELILKIEEIIFESINKVLD